MIFIDIYIVIVIFSHCCIAFLHCCYSQTGCSAQSFLQRLHAFVLQRNGGRQECDSESVEGRGAGRGALSDEEGELREFVDYGRYDGMMKLMGNKGIGPTIHQGVE